MADDPNAVAVQWDALKGSIAASGGDMAVAMQGIQNTYAGTADAAGRAYLADKEEAKQAAQGRRQRPRRAAEEAEPAQGRRPRQRRGVRGQEGRRSSPTSERRPVGTRQGAWCVGRPTAPSAARVALGGLAEHGDVRGAAVGRRGT